MICLAIASTFGRLSDAEDDSEVQYFFLCESDSDPSNSYWRGYRYLFEVMIFVFFRVSKRRENT